MDATGDIRQQVLQQGGDAVDGRVRTDLEDGTPSLPALLLRLEAEAGAR